MDTKSSQTEGGVMIVHNVHEGKHYYEVGNVVKYKKRSGGKLFVRKGDKLMQINNVDLQDMTPEDLAHTLAKGNTMLTVHKAGKLRDHTNHVTPDGDTLHPVSKESMTLSFCWDMKREEDLEENEVEPEKNETGGAEDVCEVTQDENGEGNDLLVVQMTKTSISVVSGRGCDGMSPCQGCHTTGCTLNDVIMVAESSTVTLVPRGTGSLRQQKLSNVLIEHVASRRYLRGICSQKTLYTSPNPERITIYYYKSNDMERDRGMPVVLNITDSNCYLHCCKDGNRVFLQMETCEKRKLQQISKSDESALSYVFYMKADRTKQRRFESALHRGWFINIVNTESVVMRTMEEQMEDPSFLFIIRM